MAHWKDMTREEEQMQHRSDLSLAKASADNAWQAQRDSEDRFQLFASSVKDYAIVMLDAKGDINAWNIGAEHLLQFTGSEVLHKHISILYAHAPDLAEEAMTLARRDGRAATEGWRYRKDGTRFWANTITTAVLLPNGDLHGYSQVSQDLTERRNHEQSLRDLNLNLEKTVKMRTAELEAANKELEAFSYSVSHDLRAPIRAIDGFAKVLLEDYGETLDKEIVRNLEVISRNAGRMTKLIADLLAFSKLNMQPLVRKSVDMKALAETCLRQTIEDNQGIDLRYVVADIPSAVCDEALIRQVFLNLLSNAVKFSRLKDYIEVEVGSCTIGYEQAYYVKDHGVGFDMKYADKLFGPFQRLHTANEFEGTGIGLALVQRVIRRHGGRVWGESTIGDGATFFFTLPIEEAFNTCET